MPKAFVSHSTLDQERFVLGLSERLQRNGVETWYAGWALLDGDSLTDRIFEQGIGEADIFIVVLSKHSIESNWVKAELAVGLVRQIEKKCRLIPIVLDGVEVPVALEGTFQRRIADPGSYDEEFGALLRSIYGKTTAPPLGSPPPYATARRIRDLTTADVTVFDQLAEHCLEEGWFFADGDALVRRCEPLGLNVRAIIESIHALDEKGYIKKATVGHEMLMVVQPRPRLLRDYLTARQDVDALERRLLAELVNQDAPVVFLEPVAQKVGVKPVVAYAVLDCLAPRLFTLNVHGGGAMTVRSISPLLGRVIDS